MTLIASDNRRIVIGLGQTGLSCARFLAREGLPFALMDTRDVPPNLDAIKAEFPDAEVHCGALKAELLCAAGELLLSPGVAKDQPAIQQAVEAGVKLSGDIDLFCRQISAPVIAITGSNAKSTVTSLVGQMAQDAGINTGIGGNLGTPVLDMLKEGEQDLYVLELSSFQLETTHDLRPAVATVLNISPDHLDRYDNNMQLYYQAKHRVYRGAQNVVTNRDDALTNPLLPEQVKRCSFGLGKPDLQDFGVIQQSGEAWLAKGLQGLMPVKSMKLQGGHNVANALAALALGDAADLPMAVMLKTLQSFAGLRHRCQWVTELNGVNYFNDSKGTNVGATEAALNGLGATLSGGQKVILIAGGQGKGAEFDALSLPLRQHGRALVLIGEDAAKLAAITDLDTYYADSMSAAVKQAQVLAEPGDIVLLSPACASFDMFASFTARGDAFCDAVLAL